jgi:hypothetical protein
VQATPALGETLTVGPYATIPALLRVVPDGVHGPSGVVTVEERLHDPFPGCWAYCLGPTDSTWVTEGGYIRTTGGISFEVSAPFTSSVPPEPTGLQVSLAFPNPSASSVTLAYSLPVRSPVRVVIYDITGRCMLQRRLGDQGQGAHSFSWDGRDTRGVMVPAGVYVLRLETRDRAKEQRIVIVR